jgi:hypothetical protein
MTGHGVLHLRTLALAAAACGLSATAAGSQQLTCDATKTITACVDELKGKAPAVVAEEKKKNSKQSASKEQQDEQRQKLNSKTTGPDVSLTENETAIRNFLPRLAAAAAAPGLSADDRKALGLRLNVPAYNSLVRDYGSVVQFESVLNEAKVFSKLNDALPDARRAKLSDSLKKGLNDYDDLTLRLALNVETEYFGRGYRQHADEISRIANDLFGAADQANLDVFMLLLRKLRGVEKSILPARAAAAECPAAAVANIQLDCFDDAVRNQIIEQIAALARADVDHQEAVKLLSVESGFNRLGDLINNQPQLNFGISYDARAKLVGPRGAKASMRWERQRGNLNDLRGWCNAHPPSFGARARNVIDAECLRSFMNRDATHRALDRSIRFWFALNVMYQPRYRFSLPQDAVNLDLGQEWTWAPELGFGRYVGPAGESGIRPRLDGKVAYVVGHKQSPDPKQEPQRFTANLDFTLPTSASFSTFISLKYANRPELLTDVDRKLRTRVGLSYRITPAPAK